MNWQNPKLRHSTIYILLIFLLSNCAQSPRTCPSQPLADLSETIASASNDQLAFRFPLDEPGNFVHPFPARFSSGGDSGSGREYHAAEDYFLPPGTPVYAIADGEISFSGLMDGYGWLIIVDHPQINLYSLYGHLSPSRRKLGLGTVERGDLIGYLGDADENGGSPEQPLRPHLHFGLRAGQRVDYPGMGEWRWMAGWIKLCPQDLGWLRPSLIISSQDIPTGGFSEPAAGFIAKWGLDLVVAGYFSLWGVGVLLYAIKKDKPLPPIVTGIILFIAGWYFLDKGTRMSYALFALAVLCAAIGGYKLIRKSTSDSSVQSK